MNGKHVLTTAALLLACAAGRLTAQGGTSAPAKGAAGADPRAKMMARFDKDGDGKLDKAEMAEAQKAMAAKKTVQVRTVAEIRQEMLAKYDKNGDGRLDGNERALAGKMMFESRYATMTPRDKQMILHQFDRDGDGKLSEAEKAAIHAPPASPGAPKAPSARAMIGSYDKNGDKMLDASELTQLLRSRGVVAPVGTVTVPPEVRLEILREHDKNKNGVIDPSERDAANAALDAKRKQLEAAAKADPQAATRPAPEARERLEEFDVNEDKKLDAREVTTMLSRGRGDGGMAHGRGGGGMAGGHGSAAGGMGGPSMPDRMQQIMKRFDKNGDGRLDEDERKALQAAMKSGKLGMGGPGPTAP